MSVAHARKCTNPEGKQLRKGEWRDVFPGSISGARQTGPIPRVRTVSAFY
jgi:hypothetical protein